MRSDRLKWTVTAPDASTFVLEPCNVYKFKYKLENDQVFYRKELDGELEFTGPSYNYLKALNDDPARRLSKHKLRCEINLDGTWAVLWNGFFSGNDTDFDECACRVKLSPSLEDAYTPILENWEKEFNLVDMPDPVSVHAPLFLPYQFMWAFKPTSTTPPPGQPWGVFFEDSYIKIWWSELRVTSCSAGSPMPPASGTWTMVGDNCAANGTALYQRIPLASPPSAPGSVFQGACISVNGICKAVPYAPADTPVDIGDMATDPPVIDGPRMVTAPTPTGAITGITFKVKHPRGGSSYVWSVTNGGGTQYYTIIAGQGTAQITVDKAQGYGDNATVTVTETGTCGTPMTATHNLRFFGGNSFGNSPGPYDPDVSDMFCVDEYEANDVVEVTLPYSIPGKQTQWYVKGSNPGYIVQVIEQTNTKLVFRDSVPTAYYNIKFGFIDNDYPFPGTIWSGVKTINKSATPVAAPVQGPARLCPGQTGAYYVAKRSGAAHQWSAENGTVVSVSPDGASAIIQADGADGEVATVSLVTSPANSPQLVLVTDCNLIAPGDCAAIPYFWKRTDLEGEDYTAGRRLLDALEWVLRKTVALDPLLPGVVSDLFGKNSAASMDYVTGEASRLRNLTIHNEGDVMIPEATQQATKSITTLKKLLKMIEVLFNVRWNWEDGKGMVIEHLSRYDERGVIDFRTKVPCRKYGYRSTEMPHIEVIELDATSNSDFVGLPILYDEQGPMPRRMAPGVKESTLSDSPGNVSTDLPYLQSIGNSDEDRKGFVILQNTVDGTGAYFTEVEPGAITGMVLPNGYLALANLQRSYHRHGRVLPSGYMNGQWTDFITTIRYKEEKVSFQLCPSGLLAFDPMKRVLTNVGEGVVSEATLDFFAERFTATLLHE